MFICIRQLSFGAFCKKIFHKNELQFLPESRALALKKFKKPPHFVPIKKKVSRSGLYTPVRPRTDTAAEYYEPP